MPNRRDFLKNVAGATAGWSLGAAVSRCSARSVPSSPGKASRLDWRPSRDGRRHSRAHVCAGSVGPGEGHASGRDGQEQSHGSHRPRSRHTDAPAVHGQRRHRFQAINVNAWGYAADRALARDLVQLQNEKIAAAVAAHPDRFVGMATLALQHPDLAAEQLDQAVRKLGLRGAAIGGSVEGQELSDRKFDPFWAKAEQLGVMLFMHPQPAPGTTQNLRLQGKGGLGNTIGNPLETTVFLSHLIFEGTLDRFPGLKICGAHAGGYLPSYSGRSDALCGRGGGCRLQSTEEKAE